MAIKDVVSTNIQVALDAVQAAINTAKRAETVAYIKKDHAETARMTRVINKLHTAWLDICEVNFTK
jgi:hypothetical protein